MKAILWITLILFFASAMAESKELLHQESQAIKQKHHNGNGVLTDTAKVLGYVTGSQYLLRKQIRLASPGPSYNIVRIVGTMIVYTQDKGLNSAQKFAVIADKFDHIRTGSIIKSKQTPKGLMYCLHSPLSSKEQSVFCSMSIDQELNIF